jgi:hypothetical protein
MAIKIDCPACKMGWCGEYRAPCDEFHEVTLMCDKHEDLEAIEATRDGIGLCAECWDEAEVAHNPKHPKHEHLFVAAAPVLLTFCPSCAQQLGHRNRTYGVVCAGCGYRECNVCHEYYNQVAAEGDAHAA